MAESYSISCSCGNSIDVELFEAGTEKKCPSCNSSLTVPNTIALKELAGDKYPHLAPIEKIQRALEDRQPPFDGRCHGCNQADANYRVPMTFDFLTERHMDRDGGIQPTLTGGIKLDVPEAEEQWESVHFPLLLCSACCRRFETARSRAKLRKALKTLGLLGLLGLFLSLVYYNAAVVAALSGLFWLTGVIAWAARNRRNKRVDPFILPWLDRIRWGPEAVGCEDECRLSVGKPEPFSGVISTMKTSSL